MRVSVLILIAVPLLEPCGLTWSLAWCPLALLALTRGLKDLVAVRNSNPRIYAGGKALLPVLTQLASKICLRLIFTTAPVVSTSKRVVLSGSLSNLEQSKVHL